MNTERQGGTSLSSAKGVARESATAGVPSSAGHEVAGKTRADKPPMVPGVSTTPFVELRDVPPRCLSRRDFLAAAGVGMALSVGALAEEKKPPVETQPALIAITTDLEMSMHYPKWDDVEWNYMKGNLDEPTKQYVVETARRVKANGGLIHAFLLGRTLEQENVDWLKEFLREGHRLGNHTYDHVNVWTQTPDALQFRFQRAPWLIEGKTAPEAIRENIRLTERAMQSRLAAAPNGFRTPGGHPNGLIGRPDLQKMLLDLGYRWVSSMAKVVPVAPENPTQADFDAIAAAQHASQPFVYPTGLVEIPMSPIGDVAAFRRKDKKWKVGDYLKMLEASLAWTIEHGGVFDLLTHPSIMMWEDPRFETYDLVCDVVKRSNGKAQIADLDAIARRAGA
jgi:peptidoglycan/xylan/chitin deacetylase (PgdA/CDA1 family)